MKLFKTIIFVALVATTTLAMAQQGRGGQMDPKERAKRLTEQMTERLSLTEDQTKKVEAINLEAADKMSDAFASSSGDREAMRVVMTGINKEKDKKLQAVLTEDQWKEYEKMVAEQRQRRSQGNSGRN